MRGDLWNIRGLNKAGRINCLSNFIKVNNLDFIGIQETKKAVISNACMNSINKDMTWKMLPASETAGGILVGFKNSCFNIISSQPYKYGLSIIVNNIADKVTWRLVVVYGTPYEEAKMEFSGGPRNRARPGPKQAMSMAIHCSTLLFMMIHCSSSALWAMAPVAPGLGPPLMEFIDELHLIMNSWDGPTLLGGDFNIVKCHLEKSNGVINFNVVNTFNDWISRWGLIDIKDPTRTFTWSNN
jgi:hypothetical protein